MREPINEKILDAKSYTYKPRKRVFTVWLIDIRQGKWNMYWCPDCRSPIAQYQGDMIMEYPDEGEPTDMPIMIQCKNSQCGRKIMFQSVVKRY